MGRARTRTTMSSSLFKDEKRTQYSPLMTREEQSEAVDDMENAIDDARVSRGVVGSSSSHANPAYAPIRGTVDESFESVPLKGAGRSLAQSVGALEGAQEIDQEGVHRFWEFEWAGVDRAANDVLERYVRGLATDGTNVGETSRALALRRFTTHSR